MSESIERERVRGHDARMLLEGAVSKGGVVLPEVRPTPDEDRLLYHYCSVCFLLRTKQNLQQC